MSGETRLCNSLGPRVKIQETEGVFVIRHKVGRSLCAIICSGIGFFLLSIAVVTMVLEFSLDACEYNNIGLNCWDFDEERERTDGYCGSAVCKLEYVVLEEDFIHACAVRVPECHFNDMAWQCPGACMHKYEEGVCTNAVVVDTDDASSASSAFAPPLPPPPPPPSPTALAASDEGFWCTDLDCAPCADRVHPRGGVASVGWYVFGGIMLLMGVLIGGLKGGCKYEIITIDITQADWRVEIIRKAWNIVTQVRQPVCVLKCRLRGNAGSLF